MSRYVYDYGEAAGVGRELLGGKGAGLAEMTALGIPVPAGFCVTTRGLHRVHAGGRRCRTGSSRRSRRRSRQLEAQTGKRFGDPRDPLLVSVRSGAAVSMPGMMDTILNLGLNEDDGRRRSAAPPGTHGSPTTPTGG